MIDHLSPNSPTPKSVDSSDRNATPSFALCPPVFVLNTHLTVEELDRIESRLVGCGASLTYDISEARLVLGNIKQKKRAVLELRAREIWTEEVPIGADGVNSPKRDNEVSVTKRIRTQAAKPREDDDLLKHEAVTVGSATESDESSERAGYVDLVKEVEVVSGSKILNADNADVPGQGVTPQVGKRPRSSSPEHVFVIPGEESTVAAVGNSDSEGHLIRVVKMEWFDRSFETGRLLPVTPFLVYQGRILDGPGEETLTEAFPASGVLQRAKEDAADFGSSLTSTSSSHYFFRRRGSRTHTDSQNSSQRLLPKLYHQTTSEHEENISLPPAPDWVQNHVLYACMRSAPLHPPNEAFMKQLIKIRKIRELTLDEIGVRAYSTSIASIAAYPYEFRSPEEVLRLPGCDIKLANLFVEFKHSPNGTLSAAMALDTDPVLKILHQFYNIWGVGAKTARDFYYKHYWQDLDDIIEHGWNSLTRQQQIGLKYYDELLKGIPRSEVADIARIVHRHANLVRPDASYDGRGIDCIIVGGYRRGKEICGDVDMVLSHRDEAITKNLVRDIVASLEAEEWVTHTLQIMETTSKRDQQTLPYRADFEHDRGRSHFDSLDKALVVWQDPRFEDPGILASDGTANGSHNVSQQQGQQQQQDQGRQDLPEQQRQRRKRNPNPHRRVDIIISPWRTVGCAVLGWSGDTTFERDLRRYAKKAHGWKFDSSGVRERISGGQIVDLEHGGDTWEERERLVMEGLGVGWRTPEERCTG